MTAPRSSRRSWWWRVPLSLLLIVGALVFVSPSADAAPSFVTPPAPDGVCISVTTCTDEAAYVLWNVGDPTFWHMAYVAANDLREAFDGSDYHDGTYGCSYQSPTLIGEMPHQQALQEDGDYRRCVESVETEAQFQRFIRLSEEARAVFCLAQPHYANCNPEGGDGETLWESDIDMPAPDWQGTGDAAAEQEWGTRPSGTAMIMDIGFAGVGDFVSVFASYGDPLASWPGTERIVISMQMTSSSVVRFGFHRSDNSGYGYDTYLDVSGVSSTTEVVLGWWYEPLGPYHAGTFCAESSGALGTPNCVNITQAGFWEMPFYEDMPMSNMAAIAGGSVATHTDAALWVQKWHDPAGIDLEDWKSFLVDFVAPTTYPDPEVEPTPRPGTEELPTPTEEDQPTHGTVPEVPPDVEPAPNPPDTETLEERQTGLLENLVGVVANGFNWLGGLLGSLLRSIIDMLRWLGDIFGYWIRWLWSHMGQWLRSIRDAINSVGDLLAALLDLILSALGNGLAAVVAAVRAIPGVIVNAVTNVANAVGSLLSTLVSLPAAIVTGIGNWLHDFFVPESLPGLEFDCENTFPCGWVTEFGDAGDAFIDDAVVGSCVTPAIGWSEFLVSLPPPPGCSVAAGAQPMTSEVSTAGDLFGWRVAIRGLALLCVMWFVIMRAIALTPWAESQWYRNNPTELTLFDDSVGR